jgi:hypothetical protein
MPAERKTTNMKEILNTADRPPENLYEFRGKLFMCDEWTIAQLNFALACNRSDERYIRIDKNPKKDGNN